MDFIGGIIAGLFSIAVFFMALYFMAQYPVILLGLGAVVGWFIWFYHHRAKSWEKD